MTSVMQDAAVTDRTLLCSLTLAGAALLMYVVASLMSPHHLLVFDAACIFMAAILR